MRIKGMVAVAAIVLLLSACSKSPQAQQPSDSAASPVVTVSAQPSPVASSTALPLATPKSKPTVQSTSRPNVLVFHGMQLAMNGPNVMAKWRQLPASTPEQPRLTYSSDYCGEGSQCPVLNLYFRPKFPQDCTQHGPSQPRTFGGREFSFFQRLCFNGIIREAVWQLNEPPIQLVANAENIDPRMVEALLNTATWS